MTSISPPKIHIRNTKNRGRGVFASQNFKAGDSIEVCPVIILTKQERPLLEKTILDYYIYPWTSESDAVVVLGYGLLYNHSNTPNTHWEQNYAEKTMIYTAIKPIQKGEEITVNYGDTFDDPEFPSWVLEMPKR